MRAPNILVLLLTFILATVGVVEQYGIPLHIPERALPLIGSTKQISNFLGAYSFWVMFSAWLLLSVAVFLPKRTRQKRHDAETVVEAA
jgi:hypothetical protein